MSEPAWLSYTGAITGIIGAGTGIAGAIMGYIGYRRTKQLKALDLRVELRKLLADLHTLFAELPALLELAKRSRTRVASATGGYQSGAMSKWLSDWDIDQALERNLHTQLPDADETYSSTSQPELETTLIQLYSLQTTAAGLRDRYKAELAADDKQRDHLREDMRRRT